MSKNQKQKQIYAEKIEKNEIQGEKVDMRNVLKGAKDLHKRVDNGNIEIQNQDKKLVGVNEQLDDYNKEVEQGDDLLDVVNHGVFSSIFHGIKGIFKKDKKKYDLSDKDKKILEKAKNKGNQINEDKNNLGFKEDGEWSVIKKGNDEDKFKGDDYNEDEVVEEITEEFKGMTNSMKKFNQNVKDSIELAKVTNKHIDKSSQHAKKAVKKMEKKE